MAKKASDDYIYLRKKICNTQIIRHINELSAEWGLSLTDTCFRFFSESVIRDIKKKREIEEYKKMR